MGKSATPAAVVARVATEETQAWVDRVRLAVRKRHQTAAP
jgi:hypothetical protein